MLWLQFVCVYVPYTRLSLHEATLFKENKYLIYVDAVSLDENAYEVVQQ